MTSKLWWACPHQDIVVNKMAAMKININLHK